jgi:3-hydroxyisobutyrate dehydrogenase-like beta-hydroxyacid dehydrogenase
MSEDTGKQPVGLVGLGLLGSALAKRLLDAGNTLVGFDVDDEARNRGAALGVSVEGSAAQVAARCGRIVLSLPDSNVRRELLFGEAAMAEGLGEGTLLLDTTTGRAEDLEADAKRLGAHQIDLVDVCVLASSAQVSRGDAVLLVGDREQSAGGYAPLLESFSHQVFYLGAPGDGCRMKLVANQVVGLHRLVLAEALGMAEKAGLDPNVTLEVLQSGLAASAVMKTKGRKMLDRDFSPVARVAQHAKDVDLILELGANVGANLPLSELHREVLEKLMADGFGGEDNAAVMRAFH